MLRFLTCIFFITLSTFSLAQGLVLNGGFEEENTCTEYDVTCAPEAWVCSGLNSYYKASGRAYEGTHCMGIIAGHARKPFLRTFIRSQLLCQLTKGVTYRLEFFIKSPNPILDSIGIYFGATDFLLEGKPIHRLAPSLFAGEQSNTFKPDSSWQKVILDYKAKGGEGFVTIGNFSRNDLMHPTGIPMENNFFVFLDNISLVSTDPAERLCSDWQQAKEDIYDQNARHEYLRRLIQYRIHSPALNLPLRPMQVVCVDTLVLPDIVFASSKKDLQPASFNILDSFCRSIAGRSVDSLVIGGHTDSTGTADFNAQLSSGRAETVANYLRQCAHFFRVPFVLQAWGSGRPVADNATPDGRQRNRRVEILLYVRD